MHQFKRAPFGSWGATLILLLHVVIISDIINRLRLSAVRTAAFSFILINYSCNLFIHLFITFGPQHNIISILDLWSTCITSSIYMSWLMYPDSRLTRTSPFCTTCQPHASPAPQRWWRKMAHPTDKAEFCRGSFVCTFWEKLGMPHSNTF